MYKTNIVEDIDITDIEENFACDTCKLNKINRKLHKIISKNLSKSPLELIYIVTFVQCQYRL